MIITIDGPAGAGKSTVAQLLAARLDGMVLDTGAIYRCLALQARQRGVSPADIDGLVEMASHLDVRFETISGQVEPVVLLDGQPVGDAIRTPEVSQDASVLSAHAPVRAVLLDLQRRLGHSADVVVAEGRDMGTVVFRNAGAKFFLVADPVERARRRFDELTARGRSVTIEDVLAEQQERDNRDSQRAVAPLQPAPDAVMVDSTALTPDQVVERMFEQVQRTMED